MEFARRKVVNVVHVGVGNIIDKWPPFYTRGQERVSFPASASLQEYLDKITVEAKRNVTAFGKRGIRVA